MFALHPPIGSRLRQTGTLQRGGLSQALLAKCDALITVDNWRDSEGARAEVAFAGARGIPVFHELDALAVWLDVSRRSA